jgi:predicted lipid-binding transport protein (Tim44 family)
MAASGGVVDSGSNAILQQDAAQLAELDALTISNNAAREAYGYDVGRADNLTTARNLQTNARKGMMTSILGGALGGAGSSMGGMFGGGGSAAMGTGTRQALQSTTNLNYNQAYV